MIRISDFLRDMPSSLCVCVNLQTCFYDLCTYVWHICVHCVCVVYVHVYVCRYMRMLEEDAGCPAL